MVVILGGLHSGRHDFCASLGIAAADCYTVTADDAQAFADEQTAHAQKNDGFARGLLPQFSAVCNRIASYRAVIATEMGLGIIPLSADDRTAREANGRLNSALAFLADCVVLVVAGIPRVIKGTLPDRAQTDVQLLVFRHGATQANLEKRYAGGYTDFDLCDAGREQVLRAKERFFAYANGFAPAVREQMVSPAVVYVSPMKRAVQTADLLFPQAEKRVVEGFREMDFGLFENRTADELLSDPATRRLYRAFVDSNARLPCPPSAQSAGESIAQFLARTADAFRTILRAQAASDGADGEASADGKTSANGVTKLITIVAHGGTQMSLFSQFCPWQITAHDDGNNPYYAWQTDCALWRWGRLLFPV